MSATSEYIYQYDYSKIHSKPMHNRSMREQKARKIIAVLSDFYRGDISSLSCLDVGCSTGWIAIYLSNILGTVVGMDIDRGAVFYAASNARNNNARFMIGDSMQIAFKDASFDIVACSHVYEHVPDCQQLIKEIYRILKPGGVCFFAGPNKLWPVEPHYHLFGLCLLPRAVADCYVRIFRGQKHYHEKLLTYWQLKRLMSVFEIIDYTPKILKYPVRFMATDMIRPNTLNARALAIIGRIAPWSSPTFVWILRKN